MQNGADSFFAKSNCLACHHQPAAAAVVKAALEAGVPVDEKRMDSMKNSMVALLAPRPSAVLGMQVGPPGTDGLSHTTLALAAAGQAPGLLTDSAAAYLAARQGRDGAWRDSKVFARAPMFDSPVTKTIHAMRAMQLFTIPSRKAEFDARVARTRNWLLAAKPRSSYERAEILLGLAWAGADAKALQRAGAALVLLEFGDPAQWIGAKGATWQFVTGVGMACAVTALPILVLFLQKLEILRTPMGQRILRYASLDDILIWAVLALILLDWERVGRQAAFLIGFGVAVVLVRKLIAAIPQRDRWYVALVWLAGCGYLADWSGLHYMVGAFLAGAALDAKWFGIEAIDRFRDVVLLAFMPVFFLSTGLRTSWDMGGYTAFIAAALLLAAMIIGKLAGVSLAGKILGWSKGEAWIIGWLLQTKALIMIIFVNVLLDKGIITSGAFTALLLAAIGSTMLTIPIVTPALKRLEGLKSKAG